MHSQTKPRPKVELVDGQPNFRFRITLVKPLYLTVHVKAESLDAAEDAAYELAQLAKDDRWEEGDIDLCDGAEYLELENGDYTCGISIQEALDSVTGDMIQSTTESK
jgi:hypothetical protein